MERKPSILHLVGSFHQGGSETQALQLVRLLRESQKFNVHLATLDRSGPLLDQALELAPEGIAEYRLTSFYDWNMLVQLRRFRHHLKSLQVKLVHTHDFYTNVFGMIGARAARTQVRIASRRETLGMRTVAQKIVERMAFRTAHAIVANANSVKSVLAEEGVSNSKIVTIYNGVAFERVQPKNPTREQVLSNFGVADLIRCRFVTMVANMRHRVKDYPTFLRAAQQVVPLVPDAAFLLAGEGELSAELRGLSRELGLQERCRFLGRCDSIGDLLSISDVCVLSSTAEGFSNSVLEYMAAGKPVVATDVGGVKEALSDGETGYLVRPGEYEAMARRIAELLANPHVAEQMGTRGKKVAEERFSTQAQLRSTEALYERLLHGT